MIKKGAGSLLLLIAELHLLYIIYFFIQWHITRLEMKEMLEQQHLQTITVKISDLEWIVPEKEIAVNGNLFDVKSYSLHNGQYIFTGLLDDEETALLNKLDRDLPNHAADNRLLTQLFQLLQSLFHPSGNEEIISCLCHNHESVIPVNKLPEQFKTLLTPPPEVITNKVL